jgi:hypothetical protein
MKLKTITHIFFRSFVLNLFLILIFALPAGAQETGMASEEALNISKKSFRPHYVMGVVTAIEGSTIKVLGESVTLDLSQAKIRLATTGEYIAFDSINVGMQILAVINSSNGSHSPTKPIKVKTAIVTEKDQGVFVGSIQSVDLTGRSMTLFNHRILINGRTGFKGGIKGIKDLKARQPVTVIVQEFEKDLIALRILKMANKKKIKTR